MTKNPLVSIIIPAYNAENYIKRAIDGALNQTYKNIEIIIVDDGSTDSTAQIIKSYEDSRVVYLHQKNQGQGIARNCAVKKSKGKYITFLDADDVYLPKKVEFQMNFLNNHPEYQIVYCNVLHRYEKQPGVLYKKDDKYFSGNIFPQLLKSSFINPNALLLEKEVFNQINGFHKDRYYPEDWELCLKLSLADYLFGHVDQALVIVELRRNSNTAMEIQWILKKETLKMFEEIFNGLNEKEKTRYQTESILKNLRFKLAIAFLLDGKNKNALKILKDLKGFKSSFYVEALLLLRIVPRRITKKIFTILWRLNQKKTLHKVNYENAK